MAEQDLGSITQIWETTTKISSEAIEAARAKADESSFDLDKGVVSFAETSINLVHSRDVIVDSVDNEKLVQLPISIQIELLGLLTAIVTSLTAIAGGTDEIILYAAKVEQLNVFLWQYGFYNLSSEILGYAAKMNRLKSMELEMEKLISELRASEKVGKTTAEVLERSKKAEASLLARVEDATVAKKQIDEVSVAIAAIQQAASAALASVKQQNEDGARLVGSITTVDGQAKAAGVQISTLLAATTTKVEELNTAVSAGQQANKASQVSTEALLAKLTAESAALKETQRLAFESLEVALQASASSLSASSTKAISDFDTVSKQELSATIKKMSASLEKTGSDWRTGADDDLKLINARATTLLDDETEKLQALTGQMKVVEDQIKVQLERAIGVSLFGAFQKRQESIVTSKKFWQWCLFGCVGAGVFLGGYFIYALSHMPPGFHYAMLAKLSLSLPIIYAISFCNIQYGKERRLEEEYAFKASISVSLNPYQELVGKLVDLKVADERAKYTDFIIKSIGTVFDSPTDKVYESETKPDSSSTNLENVAKQLGPILEPLAKLFGHK